MHALTRNLLEWYRKHRILYPWRRTTDPYLVWVSEILLQQTRISVAIPYYKKLVTRFPDVTSLASADDSEFLALWSGIGYYRRAENMLRCARAVAQDFGGRFPVETPALLKLPGIGAYTAGALRNLCFHRLTPAIDGNISRVLSRLSGCEVPYGSKEFRDRIEKTFLKWGEGSSSADYFQSLMELGERVCLPAPDCPACPVRSFCAANRGHKQKLIPRMQPKKPASSFHWYFLILQSGKRRFYVQDSERRFLKTAWLFPDVLSEAELSGRELRKQFEWKWGIAGNGLRSAATIKHTVTFRKITGHVMTTKVPGKLSGRGKWLSDEELRTLHTSSVIHKILKALSSDPRKG